MEPHSETLAYRLRRVIALNGSEFLGQAYLLVLGRPIDPEGFRHYESQLRDGAAKLSVVAELHASPEGKANTMYGPLSKLLALESHVAVSAATHIQDLLEQDDLRFVVCAYETILRRSPDVAGLNHYLELLRSGASKMRIVSSLWHSPERPKGVPSLGGVRGAILRYHVANSRLLGWLCRPLLRLEADTPLERRVRAIENTVMRMAQERERETIDFEAAADDVARMLRSLAAHRTP